MMKMKLKKIHSYMS